MSLNHLEKCLSVLKATNENNTTAATTHFKKVTTENNVFIAFIHSRLSHPVIVFTSNVQCARLDAVQRIPIAANLIHKSTQLQESDRHIVVNFKLHVNQHILYSPNQNSGNSPD